jgi:pimeloyl-ACP methyl ester carboxylesterase
MHPVDRAASLLFRYGPPSLKVFQSGWGDEELIEAIHVDDDEPTPDEITVRWADPERAHGHTSTDGTFATPARHLPAASRTGHVRMITPDDPNGRLVVLMAAWNDHGYRTRTGLATRLADRGVTAVMLENPYYGSRRPWPDPPIRTVADFAVMGRAAVDEGRSLVCHFAEDYDVGITGYSMGANIAALAGALTNRNVAIAGLAASHSPGPVWLDGILHEMIDWEALGGRDQADRLRAVLTRASVLSVPAPPHTAAAVLVAGRSDGYIPATAVEDLHAHWPGSELRWLRGGHATMILRQKDELVDAIVASLDRAYGAE